MFLYVLILVVLQIFLIMCAYINVENKVPQKYILWQCLKLKIFLLYLKEKQD